MPFFVVAGQPMHIRFGGRGKAPAPCVASVGIGAKQRKCCDISSYLCDWPLDDGHTCDAPLCAAHARDVGRNRHYCPRHHLQAQQHGEPMDRQMGLFTSLVERPAAITRTTRTAP